MFNPPQDSLQPLPPDPRDFNLGELIVYPKLSELPESFSLGDPLSIKDQNADENYDFCTAYAYCGASEYQEGEELSPAYSFAASKKISGDIKGWGQNLRDAAKAHVDWGAVSVKDETEKDKALTPEQRRDWGNYTMETISNAKKHYKKSYVTCKGPYEAYDNIRCALWMYRHEKRAVVLGVVWAWSLSDWILTGKPTGGFGHAVYIIGWDKDGLILVNSAGLSAGKQGTHRLTREPTNFYIPTYGAYMFLDETPDSLRDRLITENNALQILVNFFLNIYGLLKNVAGIK